MFPAIRPAATVSRFRSVRGTIKVLLYGIFDRRPRPLEARALVAQFFVMQAPTPNFDRYFQKQAAGRTNPAGKTCNCAAPLMRVIEPGVDAAGSQRARSGLPADDVLPRLA
jgi:hypothetical protein